MKTTIIINGNHNRMVFQKMEEDRRLFFADSESSACLYHIEHPEVDSYIVGGSGYDSESLASLSARIRYLNSIVAVIVLSPEKTSAAELERLNITVAEDDNALLECISAIPDVHRDTNRVEWPVKVYFRPQAVPGGYYAANVLSISSGGCFIRTNVSLPLDEPVIMTIRFKDFDFLTEGLVVRHSRAGSFQPEGLAVRFVETSPQTKAFIQKIVNEKLLGELMAMLGPDSGTGKEA